MPYVYIFTGSNSIEDGTYEVNDTEVRVEHSGGGVGKLQACSRRGSKERRPPERVKERGTFWDPIHYPPKG